MEPIVYVAWGIALVSTIVLYFIYKDVKKSKAKSRP